ncbi:HET-domain-containing protein [Annulohypoxylon nitens]|nr:HET-domain-containing protein [Annulohypoxylon nitens]
MMSTITLNPFCDRCNAVLFDDSTVGGSIAQGDDGEEFLKIGDDDAEQHFPIDFQLNDPYPGLPLLSASAEAGCKFCIFLKKLVVDPPDPKVALSRPGFDMSKVFEIRIRMHYLWQVSEKTLPGASGLQGLEIAICGLYGYDADEEKRCHSTVCCRIESVPGPCASWLRLGLARSTDMLEPDTIIWIQHMLESTAGATSIARKVHNEFVPTRLVRVNCQPPRLIETSQVPDQGFPRHSWRYAALSYCWGSPEQARTQLKTTRSSLLSRRSSIEEHDMTKVLEDAVRTCRALSIPYLWIDALCIIQDDLQDWEQESAAIGKIYGNAYLTICATSSSSCNERFLNREPADIEIPFLSKMRPDIHGSYILRASPFPDLNDIYNDLSESTWAGRAWTYQECLASVRVLAFGRSAIHFLSPWKTQTQDGVLLDTGYVFFFNDFENANHHTLVYCWDEVISDYSTRVSTYEKDRFPALSGVAQLFSTLMDDEYVAGTWKRHLFRNLLWNCSTRKTVQTWDALINQFNGTSKYVAPSWSWASCYSYIELGVWGDNMDIFNPRSAECQRECQNIETDITLDGVNPFGQIKAASMRITTKIRPLPTDFYVINQKRRYTLIGKPETSFAHCNLDWDPDTSTEPRREVMMVLLGTGIQHILKRIKSPGESSSHDIDNLISIDSSSDIDDVDMESSVWAFGLLIHPVPNTDKYRRVGIFCSGPSQRWRARLFNDCPERTVVII